jgi:hypothetical protein
MRLMENPRKFIDEQIRRSQAGKRAARRRKKALREAAR